MDNKNWIGHDDMKQEFSEKCHNLNICITEAIKLYCKRFTEEGDDLIDAGVMCFVFGYLTSKTYFQGKFTEQEFLHDLKIMFREIQNDSLE